MKSTQTLTIQLTREEKNKLDEAADVIEGIKKLLEYNKNNGFTAFQEGLTIYDSFWKIYNNCLIIDNLELIPQKGNALMDRITKVDKLLHQITDLLPCIYDSDVTDEYKATHFLTNADGTEILSSNENEIEALANLFDQLYEEGTCNTGYYDPEEDERNNEVDAYTGLYYVTIN